MNPLPSLPPSEKKKEVGSCQHPRVQVVAREDDAEYVQCTECSEIFESSEFKDMNIEETKLRDDA